MKDLGIILAAGVGLYILSQRNKKTDEPSSNYLGDEVNDIIIDEVRLISADELSRGQISTSEANTVALAADQIEILYTIFDIELQIVELGKSITSDRKNFYQDVPESIFSNIKTFYNELESCINEGINTLNTMVPNKPLSPQVIGVFNDVDECARKVNEEMMALQGVNNQPLLNDRGVDAFMSGIDDILQGMPYEPLGEPTPQ